MTRACEVARRVTSALLVAVATLVARALLPETEED
jgi:hypothetical protein